MNGNDIHKFGLTLNSQEKDWLANFLISMYSCGENLGDMREINCEEGDEAWNAWADKYEDILMSIDDNTAYELIFQSFCDPLEGDGELFGDLADQNELSEFVDNITLDQTQLWVTKEAWITVNVWELVENAIENSVLNPIAQDIAIKMLHFVLKFCYIFHK